MEKIKELHPLTRTKNFVLRHKTAIAVTGVATLVILVQHRGIKNLNGFLEEKGLLGEYYEMFSEE